MTRLLIWRFGVPIAVLLLAAPPASAQSTLILAALHARDTQPAPNRTVQPTSVPGWARVSFFAQTGSSTPSDGGTSTSFSELVTNVSGASGRYGTEGFDYGFNARYAGYPANQGRASKTSVYDGWIGGRLLDGQLSVRFGQMWLNDLGSLGSIGGATAEYIHQGSAKDSRWRVGAFYGVEPKLFELGYMTSVSKKGLYVVFEAPDMRRHVIGYVNIHNHSLIERSVISVTNYIPVQKKLFLYQIAEIDLSGPSGQGHGGLTYFFLNSRYLVTKDVEVQGLLHRGRAIDVRSVTTDQLNGRPVNAKTLEGFLYSSYGGRVTVNLAKNVRVFGGYSRDTNNQDDQATDRLTFGAFTFNLAGTGIDLNITDNRMSRGDASSWNSWYISLGRSFEGRLYVTADYTTSLSVLHFVRLDGVTIETRPNSKRFSLSGMLNLGRLLFLQLTAEHTTGDSYKENRILAGVTFKF